MPLKNRTIIHVASWLFYVLLAIYYKTNNLGFTYALAHTMVTTAISVFIFYGYSFFVVKRYFEKKRYLIFLILSVAVLFLFFGLRMVLEVPNFPEFYAILRDVSAIRIGRTVFGICLLSMILFFMIATIENQMTKERKAMALLNEHVEAQLSYLKAQINPHFLFNALNNIYSLAVVKSDLTPKLVLNLSELLRYSIYEGQKKSVLLSDEITQINNYFDLYQFSKEEEVNINFSVNGDYKDIVIEPMILIPIVENCIKHSDVEINSEGYIELVLRVVDNDLHFSAENTKNNALGQKDKVGGVGLENIKKRLAIRYPERHDFQIIESTNLFKVVLRINDLST